MAIATIKLRRDTLPNWEFNNPVLAEGEVALITDATGKILNMRIGNGVDTFNNTEDFSPADIQTQLDTKVDNTRVLTDVPAGALFTDTVYTKPVSEPISYITNLQLTLDNKVDTLSGSGLVDLTEYNGLLTSVSSLETLVPNKVDKELGKGLVDLAGYSALESDVLTLQGDVVNKVDKEAGKGLIDLVSYSNLQYDVSVNRIDIDTLLAAGSAGFDIIDVNGLQEILDSKVDDTQLGVPNGVATLDADGLVPTTQLPSYVDDVLEYVDMVSFPVTGESGKIYVDLSTNKTYRWGGSSYIYITSGAVDSVAGKTGVVNLVKADVGLDQVDNTSDLDKPISTTTQTALDGKVDNSRVLTDVPSGAVFTDTVYTHPVYAGDDISIDTGTLTGATVISDLDFNITTDTQGHVTDANALISTRSLTPADIGAVPTTHDMTLTLSGDVTGTATFTNLGNTTMTATVVNDSHSHSNYITSNANDSASGIYTFTNTTNATSATTGAVKVTGGVGVGKDIYAGGNITAYSDERIKKNIEVIPEALDKVKSLSGYTFDRTDMDLRQTGVIAQEVLNVLPEAVTGSEEELYGVNYGSMVGLLIEAIKEQTSIIEGLTKRIEDLENK
jgi:hypothetical protein